MDFTKEQEKDREKEKVGGGRANLNEEKGDRDLEQRYKNKGDIFLLLEEQHGNFAPMQGENERQ